MGRYRSRSRSYSPRRSSRSPRRKRYDDPRDRYRGGGSRRHGPPSGLLVRNISLDARPEDLRIPFERFGPVKDVYLPKNYYTGEPRGFGFVKFRNPEDAAEAKQQMNHQIIGGREITIVFAEENRKTPQEMRTSARISGRYGGGNYRRRSPPRSPRRRYHSYSRSPSPRHHSRNLRFAGRGEEVHVKTILQGQGLHHHHLMMKRSTDLITSLPAQGRAVGVLPLCAPVLTPHLSHALLPILVHGLLYVLLPVPDPSLSHLPVHAPTVHSDGHCWCYVRNRGKYHVSGCSISWLD